MPTDNGGTIVFLGPSLPRAEARSILDADYRPPVQQGMVLEVLRERPRNIVLIDGYFSWVPSQRLPSRPRHSSTPP